MRRDLRKACEKAVIPYYSPHKLGRHAFAKELLDRGYSLQFVKEAGHWKTIEVVSDIYGHMEETEVGKEVKKVGAMWESENLPPEPTEVITLRKQGDGTYEDPS